MWCGVMWCRAKSRDVVSPVSGWHRGVLAFRVFVRSVIRFHFFSCVFFCSCTILSGHVSTVWFSYLSTPKNPYNSSQSCTSNTNILLTKIIFRSPKHMARICPEMKGPFGIRPSTQTVVILPEIVVYQGILVTSFVFAHREIDGLPAVEAVAEPAVVGLGKGHHELPWELLEAAHRDLIEI